MTKKTEQLELLKTNPKLNEAVSYQDTVMTEIKEISEI